MGEKETLGAGGEEERKDNCVFLLRRQSAIRARAMVAPWVEGGRGACGSEAAQL